MGRLIVLLTLLFQVSFCAGLVLGEDLLDSLFPTSDENESNKFYTSYWNSKMPNCLPAVKMKFPKDLSEIRDILTEASINNMSVKAFGQRHSSSDIICTDGIPISMVNIDKIRCNKAVSTVTVGAGLTLGNLGKYLNANNLTLETSPPAYYGVTVGGALGTGAHGSSLKYDSGIYPLVTSIDVINENGDIATINTEEELQYYRVHLGLLGIIFEVTIKVVPNFKVKFEIEKLSTKTMWDGTLLNKARNFDSLVVFWAPAIDYTVYFQGTYNLSTNLKGKGFSNFGIPSASTTFALYSFLGLEGAQLTKSDLGNAVSELLLMESTHSQIPDFVPIITENGFTFKNPTTGFANAMLITGCLPGENRNFDIFLNPLDCIWNKASYKMIDNEMVIDLNNLTSFLTDVKNLYDAYEFHFPYAGLFIRFSKPGTPLMSTVYGQESATIGFYTYVRPDRYNDPNMYSGAYSTIMQLLLNKYGGRSHWGKSALAYHSREVLQNKFPPQVLAKFLAKVEQVDPKGRFRNKFWARLANKNDTFDEDSEVNRPGMYDDRFCDPSNNMDCGSDQTCGKINGFDYNVCISSKGIL